jgi:hypothetical protein
LLAERHDVHRVAVERTDPQLVLLVHASNLVVDPLRADIGRLQAYISCLYVAVLARTVVSGVSVFAGAVVSPGLGLTAGHPPRG